MIFLHRKQFFEKIITGQGRQLIVLNPFLDSLCNFGFKNICLTHGIPKGCFQHPQDIVHMIKVKVWLCPQVKRKVEPIFHIKAICGATKDPMSCAYENCGKLYTLEIQWLHWRTLFANDILHCLKKHSFSFIRIFLNTKITKEFSDNCLIIICSVSIFYLPKKL